MVRVVLVPRYSQYFSTFPMFWGHLPSSSISSLCPQSLLQLFTLSKRSITTNSCWQQFSLSRMRQGTSSNLLTANKCSFPVIPRTVQGCRARLAGLAHCAWGHLRGGRCGRNAWLLTTICACSLGSCGIVAIKDNHLFPSCCFLSHSPCGHSSQVGTCSTDYFIHRRASVKIPHLHLSQRL